MNLHVFSSPDAGSCLALIQAVEASVCFGDVFVHRSLGGLLEGIRGSGWNDPVVLFVSTVEELDGLEAAAEELWRHRLVLILPDDEASLLARGHFLRPRVLFSQPVELETIAAVAARMLAGPAAPWARD